MPLAAHWWVGLWAKGETPRIALKVCKPSGNTYWQICGSAEPIPDDVLIPKLAPVPPYESKADE